MLWIGNNNKLLEILASFKVIILTKKYMITMHDFLKLR